MSKSSSKDDSDCPFNNSPTTTNMITSYEHLCYHKTELLYEQIHRKVIKGVLQTVAGSRFKDNYLLLTIHKTILPNASQHSDHTQNRFAYHKQTFCGIKGYS